MGCRFFLQVALFPSVISVSLTFPSFVISFPFLLLILRLVLLFFLSLPLSLYGFFSFLSPLFSLPFIIDFPSLRYFSSIFISPLFLFPLSFSPSSPLPFNPFFIFPDLSVPPTLPLFFCHSFSSFSCLHVVSLSFYPFLLSNH